MTDLPDYAFSEENLQPQSLYGGFDRDVFDRLMQAYAALPPIEPLKLTREQLEQVKESFGPVQQCDRPPLNSVPIHIVEHVEDSTPYRRMLERLAEVDTGGSNGV